MNLFDPDGWFYKWGTKLLDMIVISIITLVISTLSLSLLFGVALAAFFYTMDKVIVHDRSYLLKSYFSSFKTNLKQGMIFWIFQLIIISIASTSIYQLNITNQGGFILIASYFILVEMIMMACYGYILMAKFNMTLKEIFTKSLLYAHKHLLTTLSIVSVIIIVGFLVVKVHPLFLIIGFGIAGYTISRLVLEMVLPKYIDKEKLVAFSQD